MRYTALEQWLGIKHVSAQIWHAGLQAKAADKIHDQKGQPLAMIAPEKYQYIP